jgi:hypothetical protein
VCIPDFTMWIQLPVMFHSLYYDVFDVFVVDLITVPAFRNSCSYILVVPSIILMLCTYHFDSVQMFMV